MRKGASWRWKNKEREKGNKRERKRYIEGSEGVKVKV